jgi:hypothetical protein
MNLLMRFMCIYINYSGVACFEHVRKWKVYYFCIEYFIFMHVRT